MSLFSASGNCSRPAFLLFAAVFFLSLPALSQSPAGSGQISGTVTAPSGAPLVGAQVVLRLNAGNAVLLRTETDKAGRYSFSALSLGEYKVSASAPGFRQSESVVALNSPTATVDLRLTPQLSAGGSSKAGASAQNSPPTFSPSGARGSLAPSGYSTGLSSEEAAHVGASTSALEPALFTSLIRKAADCTQEPVLLREVENHPHEFAPNHTLGLFYLGHADYSKAIQYLGAARSLAPGEFANSRDLAIAMIGAGRGSEAAALVQQLLVGRESDSALLRLLAFASASAGENEKAVAAFQRAAAADGGVENQFDCGLGLMRLGTFRPALEIFLAAAKKHPESARLWFGLGIAQHFLDRKQEAVSALLRSADADRDFLPPLALLAEFSSLSDPAKSALRRRIAAYLAAHPSDAEAHFVYALVLSKQAEPVRDSASPQPGRSESALPEPAREEIIFQLKLALQGNPRLARAHFLLGEMESSTNNLAVAIAEFVAALKLEPENAEAHYRLALLYRRTGQPESARKEMEAFRALQEKSAAAASAGPAIPSSFVLPSVQPLPSPRSCNSNPQ